MTSMIELRESLIDGVWRTRDGRFYFSWSQKRRTYVLQYLAVDGRYEYAKINVVDKDAAETMIAQILWAETEEVSG